jgi:hypothetical protein
MAWKNGSEDAPTTKPMVSDFFELELLDDVPLLQAVRPTAAIAATEVMVTKRRAQVRDAVRFDIEFLFLCGAQTCHDNGVTS